MVSNNSPRLLVSSGEPAGVGPDLCVLAFRQISQIFAARDVLFLGDVDMLRARAQRLGIDLNFSVYPNCQANTLNVYHIPLATNVEIGQLNRLNADYVYQQLSTACDWAIKEPDKVALLTCPIHKSVLNQPHQKFSGHTEYFAQRAGINRSVMLLMSAPKPPIQNDTLRVALATTHIPLAEVAGNINQELLHETLLILEQELLKSFAIKRPRIAVCGLNPHAGEDGLGNEEEKIIAPVIKALRSDGLQVSGPYAADSLLTLDNAANYDAFLAMYHDQGLVALKHYGFRRAVNITLGLPFVRVSVGHGTALDIAGSESVDTKSFINAAQVASELIGNRKFV